MKKLVFVLSILGLLSSTISCEPDTSKEQLADEFAVDKEDQSNPGNTNTGDPDDNGEG